MAASKRGGGARGGAQPQPAQPARDLPPPWLRIVDPEQVPDQASLLELIADALGAPIGFSLAGINPEGRFLLWSAGSADMYGYSAREMLGTRSLADISDGQDRRPGWRECLDAALKQGTWHGTSTHVRKDGTRFQADTLITPVRHHPGSGLLGFLVASRDVSEEIGDSQRLTEDNLRQHAILESSRLPLVIADLSGTVEQVNAAAENLTGQPREQLAGSKLAGWFSDQRPLRELQRQLLREHDVTGFELPLRVPDGRPDGVTGDGTLLLDPQGRPSGIALRLRDLTDIRRLRRELDETREFSRQVIDAASDGLLTLDPAGVITGVSEHATRISGYAKDELVGSRLTDYAPDPGQVQGMIDGTFRAGSLRDHRLALTTSDGAVRQLLAQTWAAGTRHTRRMFLLIRDVTERIAARERTARETAYNRGLIEASVDGLATVDFRGYISDVNARMCELMGQAREDLVGSSFTSCFTDPGDAAEVMNRALVDGKATNYELRHAGHPGVALSVNASLFRDSAGEVAGVFVSARDVSEQSRLQHTLAGQEAYNRALIESSAEAFFAISQDGVISDVNALASSLTGYSRQHLVGRPFGDLFVDPAAAKRVVSEAFENGQVTGHELTLVAGGGGTVVSFNAGVYRDPAGQTQGLLAAARDITAQKQLEDRLRSQQYYTRSLIEANTDALVVVDLAGLIADTNSAMESLVGRPREELIGTQITDYSPEPAAVADGVSQTLRDGHANMEIPALRPDGSTTVLSINASTFTDSGGKLQGIIAAGRDITERKQLEELQRRMLDQAQALDQTRADFVSQVSHELRSPLTSILGYLEMLDGGRAGRLNPEQERVIGIVQRSGQRLLALIEDLLLLSRIEAGTLRIELAEVRPAAVIEEVRESFLPAIQDKRLRLRLDLDRGITMQADAAQFERVVANLISNAVKFTPPGGQLRVSCVRDGPDVVLEVRDSGIGIPPDEQERLFTRFFRSSISSALEARGTGLGLYIVKQVAEGHGGGVSAQSAPGEGSAFIVRLPASPQTPGPADQKEAAP
ncbi:MAG: PAS domain S-box protein [Gemmatimonadota bacterium]